MDWELRPCARGDEDRLALVGQATFLETFAGVLDGDDIVAHCLAEHAPSRYAAWLADPEFDLWLAEADPGGAPVGYLVMAPPDLPVADLGDTDIELKRIYALSRLHGAGVGPALMRLALAGAAGRGKRRVLLGVHSGNARARAFYTKQGFTQVGTRLFTVGGNVYQDVVLARAV